MNISTKVTFLAQFGGYRGLMGHTSVLKNSKGYFKIGC
jgi:hypothetical protein